MMMYMLMGDKGNTNDMLMMMMLNGNNPFEQKKECNCSCKCENTIIPQADSDVWVAVENSIDAKAIDIGVKYKEK